MGGCSHLRVFISREQRVRQGTFLITPESSSVLPLCLVEETFWEASFASPPQFRQLPPFLADT